MKYVDLVPILLVTPTPRWVEEPAALWAGWDSSAFAQDEFNGPGVNEPYWPNAFDATEIFPPALVEQTDLSVFDSCADFTVACEPNVITVRHEPNVICVKR